MNLAQMVLRLVVEFRQYKADLSEAAQHTQKAAADMAQSTGKVEQAAGELGDRLGANRELSERAGAAVSQMGIVSGLAAVSIGALAYAYVKGSQESAAFSKALILSGNAAGTTSGQLGAMAVNISKVVGTQGAAAAALAEMAQASGVGRDNLEAFTRSAIKFESATGTAVSATAEQFKELAESPLKASLKLNDGYNHLTESVYRQIKALEDQGKTTAAADVAQKALADTLDAKTKEMLQNLGVLEKAWMSVKAAIIGTWDAAKDVGRPDTIESQISALKKQISGASQLGELARSRGMNVGDGKSPELLSLQAQLSTLEGIKYQQDELAKQDADRQIRVKALAQFDKDGLKYLSDKAKMEKEVTAAKNLGIAAGETEANIEERLKAIRESYNKKGTKVDPNREIDAEIAALKAGEAAKAEIVKQGLDTIASERKRGVISESDALQQTVALQLQALADKRATVEAELALSQKKTNSQKEQAALQGQIAALEAQQRTLGIKYANDYLEMLAKGNLAAAEAHHKYIDSLERGLAKMQQDAAAQDEHNARLGLSKQAIADLDAAKLRSQAVTLELMAVKQLDKNLDEEQYRLYMAQAKALRDLASAKQSGAAKEAGIEAEKAIAEEARRTAETIERTLTDALMRGFEAGKSFAVNMRDAVVNLFKTLVLRPVIQGVVGGVLGLPAAASANGLTGGGGGGVGSLISMGKSVYNMATDSNGWFQNFGSAAGWSVSDVGTKMVNAGFTSLGTSLESFGASIGNASSTINMLGDGLGYLNSVVLMSKGQWGAGIGSAIGTYFGGPLGAMIGSKIGGWIDGLAGGGTKPSIEGGFSTMGDPGTNGRAYTQGTGGLYYGGALDKSANAIVTGTTADYNAIVKASGHSAGTLTSAAFMGFDGNGGSKGSKNALDFSASLNGKAVYNRYTDKGSNAAGTTDAEMTDAAKESSAKAVLAALAETDLGPQLNQYLDSVKINGASLAEVTASLADVTNYIAFSDAVKSLPFEYLTNISVEASKALITAAGGLDKLGANIGNYFDLFGTEAEKQSARVGSLSSSFASLGITMPKSNEGLREWYKSEVARLGAMDLSVQANADAYNSILMLASGVDALAGSAEQTAATRQSWQDKIDLQSGATTQNQLDMQRDLAGATDEGTRALIKRYYAEKANKEATEATTAALKAAAESQQNWQDQLDVLTGTSTQDEIAERRALTAATDDGTKALVKQYYAEKTRQKTLAEAEGRRAQAIEAAKAAVDRAAEAERSRAQALVQVAQESVTALTGLFDVLASNIKELYGEVDSTRVMTAAAGQLFIAQALATANATGYLPDQKALAEAIASVRDGFDRTMYASQFEEDRARLVLAGELSQLKAKAGTQLSTAEQQLVVAKDQLSGIEEMVSAAQRQIDAINGVDTSIGDLSTAINAWIAANKSNVNDYGAGVETLTKPGAPVTPSGDPPVNGGASFGGGGGGGGGASDDHAGKKWVGIGLGGGYWVDDVPAFADGGLHAGGMRLVGERGRELEVTGPARYWDAATTAAMLGGARAGQGGQDASAAEIRAMREDMRRQAVAMMMELVEMRRIYKSWEMVGLPATRVAVPV